MQDSILRALVLPFDKGLLPFPDRAFLMRAEPSDALGGEWRSILVCEQSFKPAHDRLVQAGFKSVAQLDGTFPTGLVALTKHKVENRTNIARAWSLLEPGGLLVCCGANALGAASFEREVEQAIGIEDRLSKHQSRVFWLRRGEGDLPEILRPWLTGGDAKPVADSGFVARAGCFSPDHVDAGSRLLAEAFPDGLAGRVADLGGGWGYLTVEMLRRFPAITAIDLFEAEALAIEDVRTNLAALVPERAGLVTTHWHDVCAGLPPTDPYDWIITNPPFHDGAKADPALGRAFINAAWKSIRRRGKFLLVANRHLPYEAELRRLFREVRLVNEAEGFKIYLSSDRIERQGARR